MFTFPWQVTVIITGLLSAAAQGIGKYQVGSMSAFQSGLIRDASVLLLISLTYLWHGLTPFTALDMIFIIIGFLESIMMAAYYSASRQELVATTLFSYPLSSLLIIVGSGILFNEWQYFDPTQPTGIFNILATVVMLLIVSGYQGGRIRLQSWNSKIMLSALMVVVSNLVQKWAVGTIGIRPEHYQFYEYLGLTIGGIVFVVGRGQSIILSSKAYLLGGLQGLLFAASTYWYATVLINEPLSIASVYRRLATLLGTGLLGLFFFGELRQLKRRRILELLISLVIICLTLYFNQ